METIPYLYCALAILLAALASVAIWSRRSFRWRAGALAVGVAALAVGYFGLVDLLSRPKPVGMEIAYPDVRELEVLYADWTEGEAIYVLLRVPDHGEPRLYRLPWRIERAEELQHAIAEAEEKEVDLKLGNPFFDPDLEDRERLFYASPPRPASRKGTEPIDPARFDPEAERPVYGAGTGGEDEPGGTGETPPAQ